MSLGLIAKVAVFDKVPREGLIPRSPLVGERWIACGSDLQMTLLERDGLEVAARYDRLGAFQFGGSGRSGCS